MRSRKADLQQLVDLLNGEHETVEVLADQIWRLVDQQREERNVWVVVVNHGSNVILVYGLYVTEAAALKDLKNFRSQTGNEKVRVLRLSAAGKMFDFDSESFR